MTIVLNNQMRVVPSPMLVHIGLLLYHKTNIDRVVYTAGLDVPYDSTNTER